MRLIAAALLTVWAAQTYPPPFPREGVTKALDNDRVVVWDATFPKALPTTMHEHRRDLIGIFLTAGQVRTTLPDGTVREGKPFGHGAAVFQPRGVIHIEESLVEGTRAVGIELKEQPNAANDAQTSTLMEAFAREGATLRLENDRVAIWDYTWVPGRSVRPHDHDRDVVIVPLEDGRVRYRGTDGQTRVERLTVAKTIYQPRGESHQEQADTGTPRAIIVILK
jgi:quercetin dioxygenase-like cupin family protein